MTKRPIWEEAGACWGLTPQESDRIQQDQQGSDPGLTPNIETRAQRWYMANRYCYGCPIMAECLERNMGEPYGTFGGLDQGARYVLRQKRKKVAKPRSAFLLSHAICDMEEAGYSRDEIAEYLGVTREFVNRSVGGWLKTSKGREFVSELPAWRMLHAGRSLVDVARETGLAYPHVVLMGNALDAIECGPLEDECKVHRARSKRRSTPTSGSVTTAA